MIRSFIKLVLILWPSLAFAQTSQPVWQPVAGGQLMLRTFAHAPYPHASRDRGWTYQGKQFPKEGHYDDSTVGIFIPPGFQREGPINYVVHFHGWGNHVANVFDQFHLANQLADSHVNAILLVPQGPKDASDSGGGKLELDNGAFEQLIGEVAAFLVEQGKISSPAVNRIVLSTHSGGYKVTAAILDHGGLADKISDVLLLDSSYGSLERFVAWAKASPDHRLISTYTDHLAKTNDEFKATLDTASVECQTLDEATLTDGDLARRGVCFFHTVGPHNQVPIAYFGKFLASSGLSTGPTTAPAK